MPPSTQAFGDAVVLRIDHLREEDFTSDAKKIDVARSVRLDQVECAEIDEAVFLWRAPIGGPEDPITC